MDSPQQQPLSLALASPLRSRSPLQPEQPPPDIRTVPLRYPPPAPGCHARTSHAGSPARDTLRPQTDSSPSHTAHSPRDYPDTCRLYHSRESSGPPSLAPKSESAGPESAAHPNTFPAHNLLPAPHDPVQSSMPTRTHPARSYHATGAPSLMRTPPCRHRAPASPSRSRRSL